MTLSKGNRVRDVSEECPHCYTFDIAGDLVDNGGDGIHREMLCNNCCAEWLIPYTACQWEAIDDPINPIPDPNRHVVRLRTTEYLYTSQINSLKEIKCHSN